MTTVATNTPRVWVGCLGCYNAGKLIGRWVDAVDAETVTAESLGLTPSIYDYHEELWVFDLEDFGDFLKGECSPAEAQRVATALDELPNHIDVEALGLWLANTGTALADADLDDFEEEYAGTADSEEDYAQQLAEETGALRDDDQWPYTCIDWEAAARDLFIGDYWSERDSTGTLHVFRR
jgi:antirestriction protein